MLPVPVLLAGPTGSGKSAIALHLAPLLRGEIVSADSMQVFRGMDVGTAKPTAAERAQVPHHLLDLVAASEAFDAARWLQEAEHAVSGIQARGHCPILCGGTGLYFTAWLRGLDAPAPADPALRAELEARPLTELLSELKTQDPQGYEDLDRANPRRVVRAVEILRLGGRLRRRAGAASQAPPPRERGGLVILRRDPADLRRRIDRRVEAMFAAGLVEEVRRLLAEPGGLGRTASQAIGYRQVVEHLQAGKPLAATVSEVQARTWQFARRQGTWYRNQFPWATVLDVPEGEAPGETATRMTALLQGMQGAGGRLDP